MLVDSILKVFLMAPTEIQKHLNRIEGQLRGIGNMCEQGRDCLDIIQQVIAVRSSLTNVGLKILEQDLTTCSDNKDVYKKKIEQIFKLV